MSAEISIFDDIRHDDTSREFWSARELQKILGYASWGKFQNAIKRAQKSFATSEVTKYYNIKDHFRQAEKMVILGSGARRKLIDFELSKYACYLIAQNGDPDKPEIAQAQAYFNIQTFRQEQFQSMSDEEKRLHVRTQVIDNNKTLFDSAKSSGVRNFGKFNDAGYRGLYGMNAKELALKKNLGKDKILDRAGTTELAANLFRITQTNDKLQNELASGKTIGEQKADSIHFMIGGKVRQTIKDIGGTMPENLPPEVHIKEIEKKVSKKLGREESGLKKLSESAE
jgi:DNA-damage-inducible protein D